MRVMIVTLGVGVAAIGCGASGPPPSAPAALLDQPLPAFSETTLSGEAIGTEQLAGQVSVIKFFADYCAPCKKTLPATQALAEERPDIRFVGISEDEDRALAEKMVTTYGLTFPVIHDKDNQLAEKWRVSELPFALVVDQSGKVVWAAGPKTDEADMASAIKSIAPR